LRLKAREVADVVRNWYTDDEVSG